MSTRQRWGAFLLVMLMICLSSSRLVAQDEGDISESSVHCAVCEEAESQAFSESAPGKLGRGLVNIGLGWTNLFAQPIQAGNSGGNVFSGIGKGFGYTLLRTIQGVVELGLFWLPPAYGEPVNHCALGDLRVTGR